VFKIKRTRSSVKPQPIASPPLTLQDKEMISKIGLMMAAAPAGLILGIKLVGFLAGVTLVILVIVAVAAVLVLMQTATEAIAREVRHAQRETASMIQPSLSGDEIASVVRSYLSGDHYSRYLKAMVDEAVRPMFAQSDAVLLQTLSSPEVQRVFRRAIDEAYDARRPNRSYSNTSSPRSADTRSRPTPPPAAAATVISNPYTD
jgi:ABC-type multidrug transport system fused ATPase/permease subunit